MIVSHENKFIFIKTKKTASSSMEAALGGVCGDKDIITPLTEDEEAFRIKKFGRGAQNYKIDLHRWRVKDYIRLLKGRKIEFYNHIPGKLARHYLGEKVWNNYYKFCFERNPFDKVVSYIFFKHGNVDDVNDFVTDELLHTVRKGGYHLYTDNGRIIVDKIYRYEELNESISELCVLLSIDKIELPKLKSNYRKTRVGWRDVLSRQNQMKIYDYFEWEFSNLYKAIHI